MRVSPFSLPRSSLATISRRCRPSIAAVGHQRWYSIHADHAVSQLQDIDPTKLSITKTTTPKELTAPEDLVFGKYFTGLSSRSVLLRMNGWRLKVIKTICFLWSGLLQKDG
jgi:branched-chain amino acid aminotransferase